MANLFLSYADYSSFRYPGISPPNLISLASCSLPLFCILAETNWKETAYLPIAVTLVVEMSNYASRVKEKLEAFLIQGKLVGKLQIPPQRKCRDTC